MTAGQTPGAHTQTLSHTHTKHIFTQTRAESLNRDIQDRYYNYKADEHMAAKGSREGELSRAGQRAQGNDL